jgi:hypothetical protein
VCKYFVQKLFRSNDVDNQLQVSHRQNFPSNSYHSLARRELMDAEVRHLFHMLVGIGQNKDTSLTSLSSSPNI